MRPVGEDVAQVAATVRAHDLGAHHPKGRVALLVDRVLLGGRVEGGPAAARVVFRLRLEQLGAAPRTLVRARLEGVVVLAGERRLCALSRRMRYCSGESSRATRRRSSGSSASQAVCHAGVIRPSVVHVGTREAETIDKGDLHMRRITLLAAWMAVAASVLAAPLGAGGGLPEKSPCPTASGRRGSQSARTGRSTSARSRPVPSTAGA